MSPMIGVDTTWGKWDPDQRALTMSWRDLSIILSHDSDKADRSKVPK
eukprot:gene28273-33928_t